LLTDFVEQFIPKDLSDQMLLSSVLQLCLLSAAFLFNKNAVALELSDIPSQITSPKDAEEFQMRIAITTRYKYTYMSSEASPNKTYFSDINNDGTIVGYYETALLHRSSWEYPTTGFVLSPPYLDEDISEIKFPLAPRTESSSINNKGDIAGYWADERHNEFGYLFRSRKYSSFRHPQSKRKVYTKLTGINDHGIAVGYYTDFSQGDPVDRPFALNSKTGKFDDIFPPEIPLYGSATANGVNNKGHIVGCYTGTFAKTCFFVKDKLVTNFTCPGADFMEASGINNADQIVGRCNARLPYVGFLVSNVAVKPDFQFFIPPSNDKDIGMHITGINDHEDIVGYLQESIEKTRFPRSFSFKARPI
jgi:hypothetical protein